jgi:hypothetical protein
VASAATTQQSPVVRTTAAIQNAHVQAGVIRRSTGELTTLSVRALRGTTRTGLVKFNVPSRPAGHTVAAARLTFNVNRTTPASIVLRETSTKWGNPYVAPAGSFVDRSALTVGQRAVRFDVADAVRPGTMSFSVTAAKGSTTLRMKAPAATSAPRLAITYKPVTGSTPASTPGSAPTAVTATTVRIGMSAPADEWSTRLSETGSVDARRLFGTLSSPSRALKLAGSEVTAGRMPILSFKVPNNDWAGVGTGKYDAQLRDLTTKLAALKGQVFVTLHHEPMGDGTATDYAAMLKRALPILGAPATVSSGPIVNGFWWSNGGQGMTDAEIAQWLPSSVLKVSEVVAADTYQGGTTVKPGENAGVKIANMSKWAGRVGVTKLGIGEYNGLNAASITAAGNALLADPRFRFAAAFNSNENNRPDVDWQLSGDRLTAFKATVAKSRAAR